MKTSLKLGLKCAVLASMVLGSLAMVSSQANADPPDKYCVVDPDGWWSCDGACPPIRCNCTCAWNCVGFETCI